MREEGRVAIKLFISREGDIYLIDMRRWVMLSKERAFQEEDTDNAKSWGRRMPRVFQQEQGEQIGWNRDSGIVGDEIIKVTGWWGPRARGAM